MYKIYTCLIAGPTNVGKTTFIQRHKTGQYIRDYKPTIENECTCLLFNTNQGQIIFKIIDTPGAKHSNNLWVDCAIIMFDTMSQSSYSSIEHYYQRVRVSNPKIPVILVGNKCESKDRDVQPELNISYYDVSAKTNYNHDKPFLHLVRKLLGNDDVHFIPHEPLQPPTIN